MSRHPTGLIVGRSTVEYRSGRSKRIAVYGHTISEVEDKLRRAIEGAKHLADPQKRGVTPFLDSWLETIRPTSDDPQKPQVRYSTYCIRRTAVSRIQGDAAFARLALGDITEHDLEDLFKRLRKSTKPRALQVTYETLRAAFKHARRKRWIADDLFLYTTRPQHEPRKKALWSVEDARRFVEFCCQDVDPFTPKTHRPESDVKRVVADSLWKWNRNPALFMLLATTGLRLGEGLALLWDRIDFEGGIVKPDATLARVPDEQGGHRLTATRPKTAESNREAGLLPEVASALHVLRSQNDEGVRWVFPSRSGLPLDRNNVAAAFIRCCKKAGVPVVTLHALRVSVATIYAERNPNQTVLLKTLGWSKPSTAQKYYVQATGEMARTFARTIGSALGLDVVPGVNGGVTSARGSADS